MARLPVFRSATAGCCLFPPVVRSDASDDAGKVRSSRLLWFSGLLGDAGRIAVVGAEALGAFDLDQPAIVDLDHQLPVTQSPQQFEQVALLRSEGWFETMVGRGHGSGGDGRSDMSILPSVK